MCLIFVVLIKSISTHSFSKVNLKPGKRKCSRKIQISPGHRDSAFPHPKCNASCGPSSHFSYPPFPIQNNMADDDSGNCMLEQASPVFAEHRDEPASKADEACKKIFNFEFSREKCLMCGLEHDSPEFGPYCAICHDFLYPNVLLVCERQTESMDFATSGESTSSESTSSESKGSAVCCGGVPESEDSGCESESETTSANDPADRLDSTSMSRYKLPYLSLYERVRSPNCIAKRLANELNFVEEDLFGTLPPESEFYLQQLKNRSDSADDCLTRRRG